MQVQLQGKLNANINGIARTTSQSAILTVQLLITIVVRDYWQLCRAYTYMYGQHGANSGYTVLVRCCLF